MNGYAPSSFGSRTSPANGLTFPQATSPGAMDIYSHNTGGVGYIQTASPQPIAFAVGVSKIFNKHLTDLFLSYRHSIIDSLLCVYLLWMMMSH